MSSVAGIPGRRREPRFHITDPNSVVVTIHRKSEHLRATSGGLMDLSRGGLRLSSDQALPKGEEIRLTIEAKGLDEQIHTDATVCWSSPGPKNSWFIGCSLSQKIDQDAIDELAAVSALERRRDPRQAISLTAEAKTELGSDEETIQVVDYSGGGFGALAKRQVAKVGDRMMLRVPAHDNSESKIIRGKVVWTNSLGDAQAIGCNFLTREDFLQMQTLVNPDSRNNWLRNIQRFRPTQWRMVAAAVMLILTLQLIHVTRSRPDLVQRFDKEVIQRIEPWIQQVRDSLFSS